MILGVTVEKYGRTVTTSRVPQCSLVKDTFFLNIRAEFPVNNVSMVNKQVSTMADHITEADNNQVPYNNLVNTPGTSCNDLIEANTIYEQYAERMANFLWQLWQSFKRPHVLSKLLILALSSSVLGSYIGIFPWIFQLGDQHQMILTHVTCGTMIAITAATWIGHIFNQDMPRYLSVIYDIIGAILFLSVSGICFAAFARRPIAATHEVIKGYHVNGYMDAGRMLATAILALFTSGAHVADIVLLLRVDCIK